VAQRRSNSDQAPESHVVVGRVVGHWGLRGHLKVQLETDFPDRFAPGNMVHVKGSQRRIVDVLQRKNQLLVKLAGTDTPEAARDFAGALLTVPEDDLRPLAPDQYYRHDLVGLTVRNTEQVEIGSVSDVLEAGGTEILVIQKENGKELLVPFVDEFVYAVDAPGGRLTIDDAPFRD
jgi:16S rRNA processing protein RimM